MLSGIDVFCIPYKWVSTYISDPIPALPCPGWSPYALCSRYIVRPDDHAEAGRWLGKGPLADPGMADPAVPVRIEAVPGFAGVWSADRQSLWRPEKPLATGKATDDQVSRMSWVSRVSRIFRTGGQAEGALRCKMLYVICYIFLTSAFVVSGVWSKGLTPLEITYNIQY